VILRANENVPLVFFNPILYFFFEGLGLQLQTVSKMRIGYILMSFY
jgi:hypothetical protein